jgi:hypothetical protein
MAHNVERIRRDPYWRMGNNGVWKRIRLDEQNPPPVHGQRLRHLHLQQNGLQVRDGQRRN